MLKTVFKDLAYKLRKNVGSGAVAQGSVQHDRVVVMMVDGCSGLMHSTFPRDAFYAWLRGSWRQLPTQDLFALFDLLSLAHIHARKKIWRGSSAAIRTPRIVSCR